MTTKLIKTSAEQTYSVIEYYQKTKGGGMKIQPMGVLIYRDDKMEGLAEGNNFKLVRNGVQGYPDYPVRHFNSKFSYAKNILERFKQARGSIEERLDFVNGFIPKIQLSPIKTYTTTCADWNWVLGDIFYDHYLFEYRYCTLEYNGQVVAISRSGASDTAFTFLAEDEILKTLPEDIVAKLRAIEADCSNHTLCHTLCEDPSSIVRFGTGKFVSTRLDERATALKTLAKWRDPDWVGKHTTLVKKEQVK